MTTTTRNPVEEAGRRLLLMREAQELTQRDIVLKSRGVLTNQQVSRIENGQIDKPPMKDLVLYGGILGLSPNEIAGLYDYWQGEDAAPLHPYLVQLRRLLNTLPESRQRWLLHLLEWVLAQVSVGAAPPEE